MYEGHKLYPNHSVRWARARAGDWSGVRKKYCWLETGAGAVWEKNTIGLEAAGAAEQSESIQQP